MDVLVIEDDRRIAALIERGLRENGHQAAVARSGPDGRDQLLSGKFDAALLDVLLPGMDGLSVLETVRTKRCSTPILVLTAVDAVPSILRAFDLGADDYLVKPFLLEILLARLTAITRRKKSQDPEVFRLGSLMLDATRCTVEYAGRPIRLNRKQFQLLHELMRRNGLVTSREDLIEAGWGFNAEVKGNTLDVYLHGLRAKLNAVHTSPRTVIRTIHGAGYAVEVDSTLQ